MADRLSPTDALQARGLLADAALAGQSVRLVGAGTKLSWGGAAVASDLELTTERLDRVVEHNAGDLTAVLEAGVPLARAQEAFAAAGQMLAIDPWPGEQREATVGGVLATADSGPLRHRYGAPRDLVLGMTVVLSDGTVARSGGKVIKNVAGYDLAKLFCGSYGTLGLIVSVNVRLHPRPQTTATAVAAAHTAIELARAARALAAAPLELEALDFAWLDGRGRLLAQCGGPRAVPRAEHACNMMRDLGLGECQVDLDDEKLWEHQRARQRCREAALVRVSVPPSRLDGVLRAAEASGAGAVGRPSLGLSFLAVAPDGVESLLHRLPEDARWVLLDGPSELRRRLDPWGAPAPRPTLELMGRIKARFDPTRTCNPGVFVGGI